MTQRNELDKCIRWWHNATAEQREQAFINLVDYAIVSGDVGFSEYDEHPIFLSCGDPIFD